MINKTHKEIRILSLLILPLLFLPFVYAASLPTFMIVYGTVTVYEMDAVPTTTIKAYIEGDSNPLVEDGAVTVTTPGQYSMVITGDSFLDNGKAVIFKVNDTQVDESTIFFPMAIIELNLSVDCTDNDNDGYSPEGAGCGPVDCDDNNANINPDATEVCDNGIDDDCDGLIDCDDILDCSGDPACGECLIDDDCDDGQWCNGAETCNLATYQCEAGTLQNCDDNVGCTDDSCDEINDVCINAVNDANCPDRTEIATCFNDPDNNPFTWDYAPKVEGVCDPINDCQLDTYQFTHMCNKADCDAECEDDNDCDDLDSTTVDICLDNCVCSHLLSCVDNDGDGYNVTGGNCGPVDCDDNNANINPGADDVCDGIDNDCDEEVDNGFPDYDNDKVGCNYDDSPLNCGADCVDEDDDNDGHPDDEDAYPLDPTKWIYCDVNGDDYVDILDLIVVRNSIGTLPGDSNWNEDADVNNDESINILDLIVIRNNFT